MKRALENEDSITTYYLPPDLVCYIYSFLDYPSSVSLFWASREIKRAVLCSRTTLNPKGWSTFAIEAAKNNYLDLLKWGSENLCWFSVYSLGKIAIATGNIRLFKWLDYDRRALMIHIYKRLAEKAAKLNSLEILKWIKKKCELEGKWEPIRIAHVSALHGYLEILEWLKEELTQTEGISSIFNQGTAVAAIVDGHLHILKWLIENECPFSSYNCFQWARHRGHDEIVSWLDENYYVTRFHRDGVPNNLIIFSLKYF